MRVIFTIILFFFVNFSLFSQKEDNYERIKTLKIGYITEKIDLTPDEAKVFWPIYEKYSETLHNLHDQARSCRKKGCERKKDLTEKEALEILKRDSELGDKIRQVSKEKDKELLKIISAKKLLLLKDAEKEFHRKLMNHYKNAK
ncbi:hypothetical protein [Capnocytophaga stomatis]|uniref:Sensor of ECF-type sigma factor n=1 Tax=Capnocytophaga stomatis TaxID=1848904 RepID=A0A250FT90_9FLAO|nr:hypothetical protein [Capnocytophaga stomatis]ATA88372.1 hypothetical protein CGC58_00650 [Capnocytophaga stomatis]GIJ93066.1 hypothetical protein CAPN002_02840 [Capnocytophaga stomatis]GIJ96226.1 hypothetical protein CAPN001_07950 [Capnocytophaga stomatis]GIM49244.1 hypothetical protein CAPN003_06960 [Capnocytophaga stomatis]